MWSAAFSAAIGIWLMVAPAVLGYAGLAATSDRIIGPLIATVGIVSLFEVLRPVRWINLALGLWLLIAPFVLGFPTDAAWNSVLFGSAVALLSLARGRQKNRYGGGWSSIWRPVRGGPDFSQPRGGG